MDKCVRIVVAVAIWSQLTTGRKYLESNDPHPGFYRGFKLVDPGHWHDESPDCEFPGEYYHHPHRFGEDNKNNKNKDFWHKHHPIDWNSNFPKNGKQWPDQGADRWDSQGSPTTWINQGWGAQETPNSWNNQGTPNNWNNQGNPSWNNQGGSNSWNNGVGPGSWNNQGTPNTWNNQGIPNNWNNQGGSNGWNNQNRPNQGGNNNWNNQGRPTRAPAVETSTQSSAALETALCIRRCPVTPEYNPVCGSNNVTYSNTGRLECAKYCGVDVTLRRNSPCSTNTQTAVTSNPNTDVEPTRFTMIDVPTPPTSKPDVITISPDILSSIFTTTEDDNVDIDIRTRNRISPKFRTQLILS